MKTPCLAFLLLFLLRLSGTAAENTEEDRHRVASPQSAQAERAGFQLANPELVVELVACEPVVTSPVSLAWDAAGRLFVAEMNDYPAAPEGGRIRLLQSPDAHGQYQSSTLFADDLHYPASVLPWRDGLLVAAAPEILFLRDVDGDGRADERRVLLTGFHTGNQQLRVNSLTWGLDSWIYGANGRSDGELTSPTLAVPLSLRRRDFRFDPSSGRAEALVGASQFGLGFDETGERFLSWNTIPLRHEVIPLRHLDGVSVLGDLDPLQDCLEPAGDQRVYPIGPVPQTFNRESTSHFNALSGLHIFGGDALGPAYVGNAFMGETIRGLVHRRVLTRHGATFAAHRAPGESDREFLASPDPWTHFVNAATGPDGSLYLCDFYRRWVEHPGFVPAHLRDSIDWREGWAHGRIWRVRHRQAARPPARPQDLSRLTTHDLTARLSHPNAWQRTTAQRLLHERASASATAHTQVARGLQRTLASRSRRRDRGRVATRPDLGRLHALQLLAALSSPDALPLKDLLADADPVLRAATLRLLAESESKSTPSSPRLERLHDLAPSILRCCSSHDPTVRLHATLLAAALPEPLRLQALSRAAQHANSDPWLGRALLVAASPDPAPAARQIFSAGTLTNLGLASDLGRLVAARPPAAAVPDAVETVLGADPHRTSEGSRIAFLAGVAAHERGNRQDRSVFQPPIRPGVAETLRRAEQHATNAAVPIPLRRLSLQVAFASARQSLPGSLRDRLSPSEPAELQIAAAELLADRADETAARRLLENPAPYSHLARRRLLSRLANSREALPALADALAHRRIHAAEFDAASRESLLRLAAPEQRPQWESLLGSATDPDRAAQVTRFQPLLQQRGDARRGGQLFATQCAVCHRIGQTGERIGPDLSGIGSRAPEALLVDLLDPSRQITPDYLAYEVTLQDGEEHTGLIVSESTSVVVLRPAGNAPISIPRERILHLRPARKSLMPDGLENTLGPEGLRDLLSFLATPSESLILSPSSPP